jgi:hypothetical protein
MFDVNFFNLSAKVLYVNYKFEYTKLQFVKAVNEGHRTYRFC